MSEIITDESRTGRKAPGHVKQEKSVNSETRAKHKERKISISGKSLKLTNLTKIYWPSEGYTKGDLVEYYRI